MRLVFAGTPHVALPSLDALVGSHHEVIAVLTRPAARAGRGRGERTTPVQERAHELGIPVLAPGSMSEPSALGALRDLAPDCCPVVAFGALLPREAITIPPRGWVNLHFSLLPRWRGAAPVQHAIRAGDATTGATTFRIDEGLDTGPVLAVEETSIGARETTGELLDRLAASGARLLLETLDGLEKGSLAERAQPAEGVTLAPRITVEDARVDWHGEAYSIDRLVRACTPHPGAWTTVRGSRLRLRPVEPVEPVGGVGLRAGEIRAGRSEVLVGTATSAVRLGEVVPEGRRPMPATDWARGLRLADGEAFE